MGSEKDRTKSTRIQRLHVEHIDALHLPQDLESLETGRLFKIGGDGAGRGARGEEVLLAFDLCVCKPASAIETSSCTTRGIREGDEVITLERHHVLRLSWERI